MSPSPCGASDVLITPKLQRKRRRHEKCKISKGGLSATLLVGVEEAMIQGMNETNT